LRAMASASGPEATLSAAAEPLVLPVPHGAVKVCPRWSPADEVVRWKLQYRCSDVDERDRAGCDGSCDDGHKWTELELRDFTRELPLSDLECGRAHFFKVAVEAKAGWSAWSSIVTCVPLKPAVPGKCAAVFARVKDDTSALIRWTKPIDSAASGSCMHVRRYKLLVTWKPQRAEDQSESCQREIEIDDDTDEYEVTDLKHEREYRFQVAAENATGWSEYSDPSPMLLMPPQVPPRLLPPTLRKPTFHTIVVQWQHAPETEVPVESYRLRYTTSEDWSHDVHEVHDLSPDISQMTVEGLRPGKTHLFQARAVNRHGLSIWSKDSVPLKTLEATEPSKIEGLSVPHVYRSFITLKWPAAEPNGHKVTRYLVRGARTPDMSSAVPVEPPVDEKAGVVTCDLKHLEKARYWFQVAAANQLGNSPWSDPLEVDLTVPERLEDA